MRYPDLRQFIHFLEDQGELKRIPVAVDPHLEITEICKRALAQGGPALLFENVKGSDMPILANLFGTRQRVALAMGSESSASLGEIGELLASLRKPDPLRGFRGAWDKLPLFKQVMNMDPKLVKKAPCQQQVVHGDDVDLGRLPIQTCWPGDAAALITWPLVITRGPHRQRTSQGICQMQLLGKNRLTICWLAHQDGARDFKDFQVANPGQKFPLAVALGVDPATTLGTLMPAPDSIPEYGFAGLLRGSRTEVTNCVTSSLYVPANAEIVLEGHIAPEDFVAAGPFGDHTGYYSAIENAPVFTVDAISYRENPIFHSAYTGRPPDEPALLEQALNEAFVPLLKQQFPEVVDLYLPAEACGYRMAVVTIKKQYAGHARQIMMGVWSFLRQFMCTKFIIVADDDIDARNWQDVIWAISTRWDPARDTLIVENTPAEPLDFSAPTSGLGSRMGLDATNKWPGEADREWGAPMVMSGSVKQRIDDIWQALDIMPETGPESER